MTPKDYGGDERRASEKWKFTKEVSVADVLTILSAMLMAFYAYTTLDKRVTVNEGAIATLAATNRSQDELFNRTQDRMDAQFREINAKLDRLIERGR